MDWLEFISKLLWPAVVVTALAIFRAPIAKKIAGIRQLQHKDTEVTFRELESGGEELEAIKKEANVDLSATTGSPSDSTLARDAEPRAFQPPMKEKYIANLSEKHPDLLVDESWRIVEAELERLSRVYNVQNTRDMRAFQGIMAELDKRIPMKREFQGVQLDMGISMMAWIAKTLYQIRQLRIGAIEAGPETTADQARVYAREALRIAKILSQFEGLVEKERAARSPSTKQEAER